MKPKEIIDKMTPGMFGRGEGDFYAESFASLKEAWPKQRRNTAVIAVLGAAMLIASIVLAATVGGVPVVPCWLALIVVAASLQVKKWNSQVKRSLKALGITRKDFKTVLRQQKKEYGYISPWKTFWLCAAMAISLFGCLLVTGFLENGDIDSVFAQVLSLVGIVACVAGWIILLWKLNLKGEWLVAAAAVLFLTGCVTDGIIYDSVAIAIGIQVFVFHSIALLIAVPIVRKKRKLKKM